MLVTSAAANIIFKGKPFISAKSSSEPPIKSRITTVDNKSRSLQWPIINLASCTGSHTDRCLTKGLGATFNGMSTRGMWSAQKMKYYINILGLLAVKLAIQTFTKYRDVKAIHLQVDNIVALTYLMKMGGTQNLKMVELAKEIWEYLLKWGITTTAEYLPSELDVAADWKSRNSLDFSEWMLSHQIFQKVCQIRVFPIWICLHPVHHIRHQLTLHGNQILTVMQQMHFNRIGHTNSCMLFPHFA